MTKEELRAMIRVELQSILKEEFRNMLNAELKGEKTYGVKAGDIGETFWFLKYKVHNIAEALWELHKERPWDLTTEQLYLATRTDEVRRCISEAYADCRDDPKYSDIREFNIDAALEHFKHDDGGLMSWLRNWSMHPYPEVPWSGEHYVDLGDKTPLRNRPIWWSVDSPNPKTFPMSPPSDK